MCLKEVKCFDHFFCLSTRRKLLSIIIYAVLLTLLNFPALFACSIFRTYPVKEIKTNAAADLALLLTSAIKDKTGFVML